MNQMQHFSRSLTFISTFLQPLRRKLFHQVSRNKSRRKNILATVLVLIFDPIQCTLKITNINHTENLPGVYHMNIDLSFIRKRNASKIVVFQKNRRIAMVKSVSQQLESRYKLYISS